MNSRIKQICKIGLVSGIYIVLSILSSFINIGGVNIRISEFLLFLVLFDYRYSYGLVIGTAIANLFVSPLGIIDIIFGTIATIISLILMILSKKKNFVFIYPTLINGLIIGLEYYYILNIPSWIGFTEIAVFELITVLLGQKFFYTLIDRNQKLKELLKL